MTISILGCGWLGLPLAVQLKESGFLVKGSTTSLEKIQLLKDSGIEPFLLSIDSVSDSDLSFFRADVLIVSITSKDLNAYINLVNIIKATSIEQVIFISSTSVYSESEEWVTELSPASGLLRSIETVFEAEKKFTTTILRFAGLFGYDRHPGRFLSGRKGLPNPNGNVNMIHRDDCITIIEKVIELNPGNEIFNCCCDDHPSRIEFYEKAASALKIEKPEFISEESSRNKLIDNRKVKSLLGISFKFNDLLNI